MKKFLVFLSILLIMLLVALVFVAAVPVNTVGQTTTEANGLQAIVPVSLANATNLLYATMVGALTLLTLTAITMRRKTYSILQREHGLLATIWAKWKTHGSLAAGNQLKFPIAAGC
jgi:hypothetical protein